jgi:cation transport ATPase
MSRDATKKIKGEEMDNNNKEVEKPQGKEEKPSDSSQKNRVGKKKKIKKIAYYETDSLTSSSTLGKEQSSSKSHHQQKMVKQNYTKMSIIILEFLIIQVPNYLLFLSVNHLTLMVRIIHGGVIIRSLLYSLHPSIWDVVETGMQIPESDDEQYNLV